VLEVNRADDGSAYVASGDDERSVELAAYLVALRSGGTVGDAALDEIRRRHSDVEDRLARADRVVKMFESPALRRFDSHDWWGGWKWTDDGELAAGMRAELRRAENRATRRRRGLLAFLRRLPRPSK
jgi:hypothetical protein